MSYVVTIEITCDAPMKHCPERITFVRENRGGLSKTIAGYTATIRHGWHVPGGDSTRADPKFALCPKHKPK